MASAIAPISAAATKPVAAARQLPELAPPARPEQPSFEDIVAQALASLESRQRQTDAMVASFAAGGPEELHDVMLATEKLNLSFQLALQVRNRIVEAYQEIMRMQV